MLHREAFRDAPIAVAGQRLSQRRDYFIERHGIESFALLCGELPMRGRTPTKELVAGVKVYPVGAAGSMLEIEARSAHVMA